MQKNATSRSNNRPDGDIPLVLAGPILRRLEADRLTLWLAVSAAMAVRLELHIEGENPQVHEFHRGEPGADDGCMHSLRAGQRLHYLLLDLKLDPPLPADRRIGYRLALRPDDRPDAEWLDHRDWAPDLTYPGQEFPSFVLTSRVHTLLHGSCRKPHHPSGDALVAADGLLARIMAGGEDDEDLPAWPSLLAMTGDQIYADDVAGPMLRAVHRLTRALGLPDERLEGLGIPGLNDTTTLYEHPDGYYGRERLLPDIRPTSRLLEILFAGVRKPIFTADAAHNHLVTLGELLAMYLLVWSPAPWSIIDRDPPEGLSVADHDTFGAEREVIEAFAEGLGAVRRLMAHLPVAMIFDDHDVTDDWNLNRDWEETAYGHPFSTRVIGNALIAYLLGQAWGNHPEAFSDDLLEKLQEALDAPGSAEHDAFIEELLQFERWHYTWPTEPPLIVLDTRTRRWRSEGSGHKPSGLLDWEALTDLQHELRGRDAVLLVSAAPIFGVKLIENLQQLFTWLGKPLLVDAEYWLAHPGTADGILNVFRHRKTPKRFTVLSGDVHYSFVYDVELRGRTGGPDIWQICSSGLKNSFPARLIDRLDRLNRVLYAPRSPLNWLTSRRHMRIVPRKPEGAPHGRRLLDEVAIGVVEFDDAGAPSRIRDLLTDGRFVRFVRRDAEARWD